MAQPQPPKHLIISYIVQVKLQMNDPQLFDSNFNEDFERVYTIKPQLFSSNLGGK